VTASPVLEIDPNATLLRMRVDLSRWHIIDVDRDLTWCGLFLSQGDERRPPSKTPEGSRLRDLRASVRNDVPPVFDLTGMPQSGIWGGLPTTFSPGD
jgi:hypothetical protein